MLIDYDILEKFGTNDAAIRRLFTADTDSPLADKRKAWEDRIEAAIQEGVSFNLKNYQFYAAADLAWDSNTITKELVPLQLFAQGKISFAALEPSVKALSTEDRARFCRYDSQGKLIGIDIPAFHKVVVNLVRSFITRRTAALATRYTKLQPLYRYETLSQSFVAKLRGDACSQRIEMITNSYGYRHDMIQSIRDMLLYAHSVEFGSTAWDREYQYAKKKLVEGFDTSGDDKFQVEARIAREGLLFSRPHPSRTFIDPAYPPATLNTDTGCTYAFYWDAVRFKEISKNPAYFNRDAVKFDDAFLSSITAYRGFWELYYADAPCKFPTLDGYTDVPGHNDRKNNLGLYSSEQGEQSSLRVEWRERVIPKEVGLGDYPYPVWVRLVIAGGRTVVCGEILPSIPATYWGYNAKDDRLLNNAWAHDIMPWQDLMSNALSNLLLSQRSALIKIILMDLDLVNDPEVVKSIRQIVAGDAIFNRPHLLEFKGGQMAEMGMKPREAITTSETQPINDITLYYKSLMQLLGLAERVLGMSSNESAQSEPREISATESANIASTTNTTIAFMGIGIDEAVDAKKRMLYESFVALGTSRVQVPAVNRYTRQTVESAGFKVLDESEDGSSESMYVDKGATLLGSKEALLYDYNFSSRDGSERSSNSKAAEVLVNLLAQLMQFPGFAEAVGKERLFAFLNEVVLLSGAGVDLRFDLQDGESKEMPASDGTTQGKTAMEGAIAQIIDAIEADRSKITQIGAMIQQLTGQPLPEAAPPAGAPPPGAAPPGAAPPAALPAPAAPPGRAAPPSPMSAAA